MPFERSDSRAGSPETREGNRAARSSRWIHHFLRWRDVYAGAVLVLLGIGVVAEGVRHQMGSLMRMGSGYFPLVLGVVLAGLGVAIAAGGAMAGKSESYSEPEPGEEFQLPDLRGGLAIIAGVAWFILVGARFGLASATFGLVFISALGDRSSTLPGALVLAASMTAVAAALFWYALGVPFPLIAW